ncbi:MAG TPA: electron transfer flavoprotein subunit beta [Candidatus Paceibacterota bacterium]|nr:electron transfer flavoprotein subunit beta [Verrucomicrobiota bacterium]HRY49682.1 electron transfer flavoprotein subunit beta [Candidatus Paceibacterota bacterium]HSA02680.1 electron transfer flavoprotein subunit beta [Candidatus Paceibacterota bacterium]
MNLIVCLRMVPDTVEELEIAADQKSLDAEVLRYRLSDPDEHALEQALLLKEKQGGTVTAIALEMPEIDDVLFTALAKGADRAVKIAGDWARLSSTATARVFREYLMGGGQNLAADSLVLLRSQASDELAGEVGVCLAENLGLPYVGVVTGVKVAGATLEVIKEFSGGLRGEFTLGLPAVLGIQSAEKPPRYVPIAKVRAVMKSARIETVEVPAPEQASVEMVDRLYKPEAAGRARMLEGTPESVADQILEILSQQSLV